MGRKSNASKKEEMAHMVISLHSSVIIGFFCFYSPCFLKGRSFHTGCIRCLCVDRLSFWLFSAYGYGLYSLVGMGFCFFDPSYNVYGVGF